MGRHIPQWANQASHWRKPQCREVSRWYSTASDNPIPQLSRSRLNWSSFYIVPNHNRYYLQTLSKNIDRPRLVKKKSYISSEPTRSCKTVCGRVTKKNPSWLVCIKWWLKNAMPFKFSIWPGWCPAVLLLILKQMGCVGQYTVRNDTSHAPWMTDCLLMQILQPVLSSFSQNCEKKFYLLIILQNEFMIQLFWLSFTNWNIPVSAPLTSHILSYYSSIMSTLGGHSVLCEGPILTLLGVLPCSVIGPWGLLVDVMGADIGHQWGNMFSFTFPHGLSLSLLHPLGIHSSGEATLHV